MFIWSPVLKLKAEDKSIFFIVCFDAFQYHTVIVSDRMLWIITV